MMTEDLMLFVAKNSSLAKRKSISFRKAFANDRITLPGRPNVLRVALEQLAARHDVTLEVKDCDSLAPLREHRQPWANRDAQGQVLRLRDHHAKSIRFIADREP
jgi:hypothetical protein